MPPSSPLEDDIPVLDFVCNSIFRNVLNDVVSSWSCCIIPHLTEAVENGHTRILDVDGVMLLEINLRRANDDDENIIAIVPDIGDTDDSLILFQIVYYVNQPIM